jgi:hypothetical protein
MAQHGVHKNIAASLFLINFNNLHTFLQESSHNFEFFIQNQILNIAAQLALFLKY